MREPRRRSGTSTAALRPRVAPDWQPRTQWELLAGLLRRKPLHALPLLLNVPFWAARDFVAFAFREVLHWDGRNRIDVNWRHPAALIVVPVMWLVALLGWIFVAPFTRGLRLFRPKARKPEVDRGRQ